MKKMYSILVVCILLAVNAFAQEYNVLLIPDSLKKDANAVLRNEEMRVIIKGIDKAVVKHKYAITILNSKGLRYSYFYRTYDKLRSLGEIDGNLYDAFGKKIKNVKKKDIEDHSSYDGYSLATDDRYKSHQFYYTEYPYTVEYEYELEFNGIYYLPAWRPFRGFSFSVLQSRFILESPTNYNMRFKLVNYAAQPSEGNDKNSTYKIWEIKNTQAFLEESYSPSLYEISPIVYVAPSDFSVGNYKGNMDTWLNYGKFQIELNKGRDELPDDIKQKVHELTDHVKDPRQKAEIIYRFLQEQTHYISVQLGIGGWQPFDAKYVAKNKYGDCKALSNYTIAMLKEAGIKANYVIIEAGDDPDKIDTSFPMVQFNHVTVCVPLDKDSIWLECTDQTKSFGYAGDFTGNRQAILIDDDGGHVVNTPRYTADENTLVRNIKGTIDVTGKLMAESVTIYKGQQQDDVEFRINHHTNKEVKDYLLESAVDLPNFEIPDFKYDIHKARIPSVTETLQLVSPGFASVSGKRFFITPNIMAKSPVKLKSEEQRKYDIVYNQSFRDMDTVMLEIPAGYSIEAMPKNVSLNSKFGKYEIHFSINANTIKLTRQYERTEGRFPPSDYAEFVKFYDDIYKADRSKIVFVKKEG